MLVYLFCIWVGMNGCLVMGNSGISIFIVFGIDIFVFVFYVIYFYFFLYIILLFFLVLESDYCDLFFNFEIFGLIIFIFSFGWGIFVSVSKVGFCVREEDVKDGLWFVEG